MNLTQAPITERPSAEASCPHCGGARVRSLGASHTLVGGGDGTRDGDPNHWWEQFVCRDCEKHFLRETKDGNTWYTESDPSAIRGGLVLRGMPSCFESYVYTHADCGGAVMRSYTALDGLAPVTGLLTSKTEDGRWVRQYRTWFQCDRCGTREESATDTPLRGPRR